MIVKSPVGMPGRAIRTPFIQARMQEREQVSHCYQCMNRCDIATTPYCITGALVRAVTGDVDNACLLYTSLLKILALRIYQQTLFK